MVCIIDQVMTDERNGLSTVISPAQEQLVETGSDKLPCFPWDPGVHLVRNMFHYMKTQVAPESHTLHLGLFSREPAGTCPVGRDLSSLMSHHDREWICLDGYFLYRDVFTDTIFGQQVQ
jgi:hypothetical protein